MPIAVLQTHAPLRPSRRTLGFQRFDDRFDGTIADRVQHQLVAAIQDGLQTLACLVLADQPGQPRRYRIRATPEQTAEILARLKALAELCEDVSAPEGQKEFGVTLAFYETPKTAKRRIRRTEWCRHVLD